ncbi:MAG: HEPN domain-containing protein [Bacteroidota bacterium]|nr:HEPN domain-containing protein [Bacteroidota bacterium]
MNLQEIEHYWLESSDDDFDTAEKLFLNKKYVQSMFFLHLSIEKVLKAVFVRKNNVEAPYGHNLQYLATKIVGIQWQQHQLDLLAEITSFNISARYDDYKRNFYNVCDKQFAEQYLQKGNEMREWFKSQIR